MFFKYNIFLFFFLYKLLSLIKNDKRFISLGLFFGFICAGSISNFLMLRESALQEMFFIITTYIFVILYKKIINPEIQNITYSQILYYSLIFALFFLSAYFSLIYIVLLFITLIILTIEYKNFNILKKILFILGFTYIFTALIYPNFIHDILYSNNVINNSIYMLNNLENSIKFNLGYLCNFIFYKGILFILLTFIYLSLLIKKYSIYIDKYKITSNELNIIFLILFLTCSWCFIIMLIEPLHNFWSLRYIAAATTILCLLLILCVYKLRKNLLLLFLCVWFLFSTLPIFYKIPPNSITGYNNIGTNSNTDLKFPDNTPIIILMPHDWSIMNYFIYTEDDRIIRFENKLPDKNYKYNKFVIITHKNIDNEIKNMGVLISKEDNWGHNIYYVLKYQ